MPITRDRLIDLINIYEIHIDRIVRVEEQSKPHIRDGHMSYNTGDIESLYFHFKELATHIEYLTKVRRTEYDIFKHEKDYFEQNANRNYRNRASMQRKRLRKANLDFGEDGQALDQKLTQEQEQYGPFPRLLNEMLKRKLSADVYNILANRDNNDPVTHATIGKMCNEHEETVASQIIPFMLDMRLITCLDVNSYVVYKSEEKSSFGTEVFEEPPQ